MTAALILGMCGESVLLIEKSGDIGGSLNGFHSDGVYFNTGFHFAGGFGEGELFREALDILGLTGELNIIPFGENDFYEFLFEDEDERYSFNFNLDRMKPQLKEDFPGEEKAVEEYFDRMEEVAQKSNLTDIQAFLTSDHLSPLDEDFVSFQSVLDDLTENNRLKSILSDYKICYGTEPAEISFADHSRICYYLHHSPAYIERGGKALVKAYREKLRDYKVDIRVDSHVVKGEETSDGRRIRSFHLNTGEEIKCKNYIFTIHPEEILKTLPEESLSPAFKKRISDFEPSKGFFNLYGTVESTVDSDNGFEVFSIYPDADNLKNTADHARERKPLVIFKQPEGNTSDSLSKIYVMEPTDPDEMVEGFELEDGTRSEAYYSYKEEKKDSLKKRTKKRLSLGEDTFEVRDSASMLTFRDRLNSPFGSAYGIKQKMGQINLLGKLPLRNVYAAGQSALLPGVLGAMMSSFVVTRSVLGEERLENFINEGLSNE